MLCGNTPHASRCNLPLRTVTEQPSRGAAGARGAKGTLGRLLRRRPGPSSAAPRRGPARPVPSARRTGPRPRPAPPPPPPQPAAALRPSATGKGGKAGGRGGTRSPRGLARRRGAVRARVPAYAPRPATAWPGPAAAAPPPPRVPPGDSPRTSRSLRFRHLLASLRGRRRAGALGAAVAAAGHVTAPAAMLSLELGVVREVRPALLGRGGGTSGFTVVQGGCGGEQ